MLERRKAILQELLLQASAEAPIFRDESTKTVDAIVTIRSVTVARDFIGSPILHARVCNAAGKPLNALIQLRVRDAGGRVASASQLDESLAVRECRPIDILVPQAIVPAAVFWSAQEL